ncbi:MAG: hypothetical protein C5B60_04500 [Chloroflexi bacterium]|nr:MAG: hypothetical protein C5B60_04500 [Chloroflexota bacterium]
MVQHALRSPAQAAVVVLLVALVVLVLVALVALAELAAQSFRAKPKESLGRMAAPAVRPIPAGSPEHPVATQEASAASSILVAAVAA